MQRDYRVWFPLFLSSLHNCECLSFIWPSQLEVIKASKYVQRKVIDWGSQRGEAETEGLMAASGVMGSKWTLGNNNLICFQRTRQSNKCLNAMHLSKH